jgi:hypothetical protein
MSQINVDIVEPFTSGADFVTVNGMNAAYTSSGTIQLTNGTWPDKSPAVNSVVIGQQAGVNAYSQSNVLIGNSAGGELTLSGSFNTFVGESTGAAVTSGANNTLIGKYAGWSPVSLTTGSNNICIGNQANTATATASNTITLGNSSITTLRCAVTTITSLSDARDKKDVAPIELGLEFVKELNPVKFVWNDRNEEGKHDVVDSGFIAQDLKALEDKYEAADVLKLVYDENPDKLEASYGRLIPVLVKAIQELTAKVETLENKKK